MNRRWWALKLAGWLLLVLFVLLMIVLPVTMSIQINGSGHLPGVANRYLLVIEQVQRYVMQVFVALWFFAVGSCFASFLNVVAWRVPRGRTILGSSHCPNCNVRLSFRDNLPLIGWIRNQGKCRTCKAPIPARYLLVEIFLGSIFLLFAMSTLATGGITLPIREPGPGGGLERVIFDPQFDLIQIVSFHLILILFLFTFSLVALENRRIPVSIFVTGIAFGLGMPLIWPAVQLINWQFPFGDGWPLARFAVGQLIYAGTGMLAGLTIGAIVSQHSSQVKVFYGFGLLGLFLGWQSTLVVLVWFLIISLFQSLGARFSGTFGGANARLLLATLVHLMTWRWLNYL